MAQETPFSYPLLSFSLTALASAPAASALHLVCLAPLCHAACLSSDLANACGTRAALCRELHAGAQDRLTPLTVLQSSWPGCPPRNAWAYRITAPTGHEASMFAGPQGHSS